MRNVALFAAASLLLFTAAGQAQAVTSPAAPTATLNTAQVNFQDSGSVADLYARIERISRKVCDAKTRDLTVRRDVLACRGQATEAAVAKLSRPLLTAAHQARTSTTYARGY